MPSLRGWQRDTALALFFETFATRTIGMLLGWSGTGKSFLVEEFVVECLNLLRQEKERRRLVYFTTALEELSEAGVFRNPPRDRERGWLLERFGGNEERRASRREIEHWGAFYRSKPGAAPSALEEKQLEEDEPTTVPTPVRVTPSSTYTPTAFVRAVYRALGSPRNINEHFTDQALHASFQELNEKRSILLMVDEAQRLEPKTLAVVREFHDDAGGTPIVLIATPEIRATLARPQMASLLSRVAFEEQIGPISEDQLAQWRPELPAGVRTALSRASGGNFRTVVNLLRAGEQVRKAMGDGILTVAHLQEAARMVPGIRWRMAPEEAAAAAEPSRRAVARKVSGAAG